MTNPWLTGATCCCALDGRGINQCDPPLVISAMAIVITIAHGLASACAGK